MDDMSQGCTGGGGKQPVFDAVYRTGTHVGAGRQVPGKTRNRPARLYHGNGFLFAAGVLLLVLGVQQFVVGFHREGAVLNHIVQLV